MKRMIFISFILCFSHFLNGQEVTLLEGVVTFRAAENVYVRFENTELISSGDTIHSNNNFSEPCLVVIRKSSSSIVCHNINNCLVGKNDTVFFRYISLPDIEKEIEELDPNLQAEEISKEIEAGEYKNLTEIKKQNQRFDEKISGRISAASQSNFSNIGDQDRHRILMRFTLNADHISNSKFSMQSYINYRKNYISSNIDYSRPTSFYNVYNLALTYQLDSLSRITLGRKINQKVSSIGPIDGLQVEKYLGHFFIGSILGFKPDISNFGFNSDLLEYGGYVGYDIAGKNIYSLSTFGLLEQRKSGSTDRRYGYFQHSSTYSNNISFFTSAEIDLFENIGGVSSTNLRLSNIYTSIRIKPLKKLSVTISYDARKRIILYETFRTDIEQLLADDQARQGLRLRINVNPLKNITGGFSFSKRFQNDSENKSDNFNVYISHSRLPTLNGRMVINLNKNKSNYLESTLYSMRYSRQLMKNSIEGEFYYRLVYYNYFTSESKSEQQFFGSGFSFRISKNLVLSILGEYSTRDVQDNLRLNTRIIKRFYKK